MNSEFVTVAVEVAQEAGVLLLSMISDARTTKLIGFKRNPTDLVTRADRMAEELIVRRLTDRFSDHAVLAEEGTTRAEGAYRWIIDPLDGTTNFAHGLPWFAVSIALEHAGQIVAGVVYHPGIDELFVAERGQGAFVRRGAQEEPLRVSDIAQISEAVVATGLPFDVRETGRNLAQISLMSRTAIEVRMMGSAAINLAYVAAGRLAAFWEPGLNPWDVAAGSVLVEEAGGSITDMRGGPYQIDCSDVLATNGRVHREMLAALAS